MLEWPARGSNLPEGAQVQGEPEVALACELSYGPGRAVKVRALAFAAFDDASLRSQLSGLVGLSCRTVVRRIGTEAWRGYCRGTEVAVEVDEERFTGSHPFLLASVLNRFFGLYGALNSFTQLVLTSRQRHGIWRTWEPLAGDRAVL